MAAFGEEYGVCLLKGLFDCHRLDSAVVDEEEDRSLFNVIVGVAGPAQGFEAPCVVADGKLDELVRDSASMDLSDAIHRTGV